MSIKKLAIDGANRTHYRKGRDLIEFGSPGPFGGITQGNTSSAPRRDGEFARHVVYRYSGIKVGAP